ncbi:MAG TPA: sulfite exporter TauE/SafE family protein [Noviherbaspirillum sp.]
MQDSVSLLPVLVALTFLLAGFVKGVIGLGLPTVAVGLLGLVMAPSQAVALLVVPSLVTNLWQLLAGPAFLPLLLRLWPMLFGLCIGAWLSAGWLSPDAGERATAMLGMALVAYAAIGLRAQRFHVAPQWERWLSPLVGMVTGMIATTTGVFVVPAVPYLQALNLGRDDLVQALGLSFTVSTIALAVILLDNGGLQLSVAGASVAALVPAFGGMLFGQRMRRRIRPETFRRCFFVGLLLLGAHLALRPAF